MAPNISIITKMFIKFITGLGLMRCKCYVSCAMNNTQTEVMFYVAMPAVSDDLSSVRPSVDLFESAPEF